MDSHHSQNQTQYAKATCLNWPHQKNKRVNLDHHQLIYMETIHTSILYVQTRHEQHSLLLHTRKNNTNCNPQNSKKWKKFLQCLNRPTEFACALAGGSSLQWQRHRRRSGPCLINTRIMASWPTIISTGSWSRFKNKKRLLLRKHKPSLKASNIWPFFTVKGSILRPFLSIFLVIITLLLILNLG